MKAWGDSPSDLVGRKGARSNHICDSYIYYRVRKRGFSGDIRCGDGAQCPHCKPEDPPWRSGVRARSCCRLDVAPWRRGGASASFVQPSQRCGLLASLPATVLTSNHLLGPFGSGRARQLPGGAQVETLGRRWPRGGVERGRPLVVRLTFPAATSPSRRENALPTGIQEATQSSFS